MTVALLSRFNRGTVDSFCSIGTCARFARASSSEAALPDEKVRSARLRAGMAAFISFCRRACSALKAATRCISWKAASAFCAASRSSAISGGSSVAYRSSRYLVTFVSRNSGSFSIMFRCCFC